MNAEIEEAVKKAAKHVQKFSNSLKTKKYQMKFQVSHGKQ